LGIGRNHLALNLEGLGQLAPIIWHAPSEPRQLGRHIPLKSILEQRILDSAGSLVSRSLTRQVPVSVWVSDLPSLYGFTPALVPLGYGGRIHARQNGSGRLAVSCFQQPEHKAR
jgi:hypothetical protein